MSVDQTKLWIIRLNTERIFLLFNRKYTHSVHCMFIFILVVHSFMCDAVVRFTYFSFYVDHSNSEMYTVH